MTQETDGWGDGPIMAAHLSECREAYRDHLLRMEEIYKEHLREIRNIDERIRYAEKVGG